MPTSRSEAGLAAVARSSPSGPGKERETSTQFHAASRQTPSGQNPKGYSTRRTRPRKKDKKDLTLPRVRPMPRLSGRGPEHMGEEMVYRQQAAWDREHAGDPLREYADEQTARRGCGGCC